jgi:hypothetical protein
MLRYFIAGHFWLLFLLSLLFGAGDPRTGSSRYHVLGFGSVDPAKYNILVLFTLAVTGYFTRAWWMTRDDVRPIKGHRHPELDA